MNLRVDEKEDLPLVVEWSNDSECVGTYNPLMQLSKPESEKEYDNLPPEVEWSIIEKKDGSLRYIQDVP